MILEIGMIVAERYEIVEQIGAGGMSCVYRAVDKKLHRNVTFKVLREEYIDDANFVNRFTIEARNIASLNHANIVNVYDVGSEGNINYIVMEYIHGKTLKELISEKAPFTNDAMLGVASQIAAALIHAHEAGIIHRDVKPQNVLCMPNGIVKVADFGIARSQESRSTSDEFSTMGSVHYISPEVACNDPVDPRSDLYSLGIVMYEMMTGELPFDSEDGEEIAMMHVESPFPNVRKKNPEILPIVREIINKLTNKQPFRRYQSANSLYADIQRAIVESTADENYSEEHESEYADDFRSGRNTDNRPNWADFSNGGRDDDTEDDYEIAHSRPQKARRAGTAVKSVQDKRKERIILAAGLTTAAILVGLMIWVFTILFSNLFGSNDDTGFVVVPVLVAQELEWAREYVESLGLTFEVYGEEFHDTIPEGYITQANRQGGSVEIDHVIQVVVSLGSEMIEVPDITGMDLDAAVRMFDNLSLSLSQSRSEASDTVPQNHIISQSPEAYEVVAPGTVVNIVLSTGTELEMISVPNIIGLTEAAARSALLQAGLSIGTVNSVESPVYSVGLVIGQGTNEGRTVHAGTSIDFTVSAGILPPATPEPTPAPGNNEDEEQTGEPAEDENENNDENGAENGNDDDLPVEEDEPQVALGSYQLELTPVIPEGQTVRLSLSRVLPDGSTQEVFAEDVSQSDLPVRVTVHGTGHVEFLMHIDGVFSGRAEVVFSE